MPLEARKRHCNDEDSRDSFDSFDEPIDIPAKKFKTDQQTPGKQRYRSTSRLSNSVASPGIKSTNSAVKYEKSPNVSRDSFDSLDSWDSPVQRVSLLTKENRTPSKLASSKRSSAKRLLQPKFVSSGIDNFPTLCDPNSQVLLKVTKVDSDEHGLVLTCAYENPSNFRTECLLYLEGQWKDTVVEANDRVRLIGPVKAEDNSWYQITDTDGIIIVNGDTLISCTSTASSFWCPRKVLLNDEFKVGADANKAMLIGIIMHELFQLAADCPDPSNVSHDWLLSKWRESLSIEVMQALAALNFTPRGFETEMKPYADIIVNWMKAHVPGTNRPQLVKPMSTGASISALHDIEENVWEPMLGLKGKIDASFKVSKEKDTSFSIEPLELKTGKSSESAEHSAQVLLYLMMLSARYYQPIVNGSLLYLKDGRNPKVQPREMELKGLIQTRNRLSHFKHKKILPAPKTDPKFCDKCEHALACSLTTVTLNEKDVPEKFTEFAISQTAHLSDEEKNYFMKWCCWMRNERDLDQNAKGGTLSDIWNISADDRTCPHRENVLLSGSMCVVSGNVNGRLIPGILLSFIVNVDEHSVTMRSDRHYKLLRIRQLYDIDVYDSFSTYSTILGNVVMLMWPDESSTNLRELLISLKPPTFYKNYELVDEVEQILDEMKPNDGQRQAVLTALRAKDYALIEGFPGTGKTTSIVALIRCLIATGSSVLLVSYTNSAVDNVLSKLTKTVNSNLLLRLGKVTHGREEVETLTLDSKLDGIEDPQLRYAKIKKTLKHTAVVACTCHHSARDVLFSWRKFDVCIVDEASMVLETVVLSALTRSSRFIMVGDSNQLAPLVINRDSRNEGMAISLFERLQVHKNAVTSLEKQFRMNRCLSKIASQLFYSNRLLCANEEIAETTISLVDKPDVPDCMKILYYALEPFATALSSKMDDSALFIDTKSVSNLEYAAVNESGGVANPGEAKIVANLVDFYVKHGVLAEEIGVMCTYRKQVDLVLAFLDKKGVEVNTIDQYQGRDKSVIIWSLVWTNSMSKRSELLHDHRRVNVAVTRAKHKLVLVGCQQSLTEISIMSRLMSIIPLKPL